MNLLDFLLAVIVLLAIYTGWRRGFILGATQLAAWVGSLLTGYLSYPFLASWLHSVTPALGPWTEPMSFLAIVLMARFLFAIVGDMLLSKLAPNVHRNPVNQVLGVAPGFVNGLIGAALVTALLFSLPLDRSIQDARDNSKIASNLVTKVEWANDKLSPIFSGALSRPMIDKVERMGENEFVTLDFKVAAPEARADLEAKMLEMVNRERVSRGLRPLKADPELTEVARAHSTDMFARGYFSHYSPEKNDPFDRMKKAKVRFLSAGENLALGPTLQVCHKGLMESPGHRANILQPSFGRLGIGVMDGGRYGLMISQEFRN